MTTLSIIFLIIIIYLIIGWLFAIICTTGLTGRVDLLICLFWIVAVPFVIIKERILKNKKNVDKIKKICYNNYRKYERD